MAIISVLAHTGRWHAYLIILCTCLIMCLASGSMDLYGFSHIRVNSWLCTLDIFACNSPFVDVWHFPAFVDRAVYGDVEYTFITE